MDSEIDVELFKANSEKEFSNNIAKLNDILSNYDPYQICCCASYHYNTLFTDDEIINYDDSAITKAEMLAHYCLAANPKGKEPANIFSVTEVLNLMDKIQNTLGIVAVFDAYNDGDHSNPANSLKLHHKFVRGIEFPHQMKQKIKDLLCPLDDYFFENAGFTPTDCLLFIESAMETYIQLINDKITPTVQEYEDTQKKARKMWRQKKDLELTRMFKTKKDLSVGVNLEDIYDRIKKYLPIPIKALHNPKYSSPSAIERIVTQFGLNDENAASIRHPDTQNFPILKFPHQAILINDQSTAAQKVWEFFDKFIKENGQKKYSQYQNSKGKYLENEAGKNLIDIFGEENVYCNVSYPDPTKGKGFTAELDIIVHFRPYLLIIEAKAKEFKASTREGDLKSLRNDIQRNIQDSLNQSARVLSYIESAEAAEFIEANTGRKLKIKTGKIKQPLCLSILFHDMHETFTRLYDFKKYDFFKDKNIPLAISLPCLELITGVVESPDVFLNYLHKRDQLQARGVKIDGDELAFFNMFIANRLNLENQLPSDWDLDSPDTTIGTLGLANKFHDLVQFQDGNLRGSPNFELCIPENIKYVINTLQKIGTSFSRQAIQHILNLPDEHLATLDTLLERKVLSYMPEEGEIKRVGIRHPKGLMIFYKAKNYPNYNAEINDRVKAFQLKSDEKRICAIALDGANHARAVFIKS